ncbi:GntR family transcriptional regulator [Propionibacteriaceae bacterium Y2011]
MLIIDPTGRPPYEQLRTQLINQITSGELPPGTRLPPVRRLADDLGLAPNTVARTYRELEAAGFVRTRGRNGTVVSSPDVGDDEVHTRAVQLTTQYVAEMRGLGIDRESLLGFVQRAMINS